MWLSLIPGPYNSPYVASMYAYAHGNIMVLFINLTIACIHLADMKLENV